MPISSVLAGEVCARCNNGWMSTLETEVAPVLTASRRRGVVSDADALVLARWFTKTAVALNVSMPFRLLFDAPTRHSLAGGMPSNVAVGLSKVRSGHGAFDWVQSVIQSAHIPDHLVMNGRVRDLLARAYVGRIRVDRLVGTVVVLPGPLRFDQLNMGVAQIWPIMDRQPTWGAVPTYDHYLDHVVEAYFVDSWLV
jgi:hypothetical protein